MDIFYLKTSGGEEYSVGNNCERIEEHQARGDGDKWFYDVYINDENNEILIRSFNPLEVRINR